MRTIVAPTDFSPDSLNAVNYAADLCCVIGTNLALIHVCPIPAVAVTGPVPNFYTYDRLDPMKQARKKMEQLKEDLKYRTRDRILIKTEINQGNVIQSVEEYCSSLDTYAVVMGPDRKEKIDRLIFGGKTISAIRKLSWPLIAVPAGVKFGSICRIGLACELEKLPETIPIKEIKQLVKEFNAALHVLHISAGKKEFDKEFKEDQALLKEILKELHPVYHFIKDDNIEQAIVNFTERNSLDLLIIIPKNHSLLNKLFRHSHSKRLVLFTHVPVMAIHE